MRFFAIGDRRRVFSKTLTTLSSCMNVLIDGPTWLGPRAFESLYAADIRTHMFKTGVRFHAFIDGGGFNTNVREFLTKHAPQTLCIYYSARHGDLDKTDDIRTEGPSLVFVDGDLVSARREFLRIVGALSPIVIEHWPVLSSMSDVWNVAKATMLGVLVTQQQVNLFDMCTGSSTVKLSNACLREIGEVIERHLGNDDSAAIAANAEAPFENDGIPIRSAPNRLKRCQPPDSPVTKKSFVANDDSSIESIDDDDSRDRDDDDDDDDDQSFNPPEKKFAKTSGGDDGAVTKLRKKVLISIEDDEDDREVAGAEPLEPGVATRSATNVEADAQPLEQLIDKAWLDEYTGPPVETKSLHEEFALMIKKPMSAWKSTTYGKRIMTLIEAMWNNIGPAGKTQLRTTLMFLAQLGRVCVSRQTAKDRLLLGKTKLCVLCGKTTHETKMIVAVKVDTFEKGYLAQIDPTFDASAPLPCGQCCGRRAESLATLQRMMAAARIDATNDSPDAKKGLPFDTRVAAYAETIDMLMTNAIKANGYKE